MPQNLTNLQQETQNQIATAVSTKQCTKKYAEFNFKDYIDYSRSLQLALMKPPILLQWLHDKP